MPEQDPLAQLRDIHLPDAINTWPPAPGWWILGALILIAVVLASFWLYNQYKKNAYRRQAMEILKQLEKDHLDQPDIYLPQINQLLKRTAIASNSTTNIAGLTGKNWLDFLDQSAKTSEFSQGAGKILLEGPYAATPPTSDMKALHSLSEHWIKRHRVPC